MSSYYDPHTVWYLDEQESQEQFQTEDGRQLDLASGNPFRILNQEADGRDLVEGELRRKGHAIPSLLEKRYGIPTEAATVYLETLEEEGICYATEWPGSYSAVSGW